MSKAESTADGIVGLLAEQFGRSFTIGTDTRGYDHHFYRPADTVVVYDDTGVERYRYLDGKPVAKWEEFVDAECGWRSKGPFARLGIKEDLRRKEATA